MCLGVESAPSPLPKICVFSRLNWNSLYHVLSICVSVSECSNAKKSRMFPRFFPAHRTSSSKDYRFRECESSSPARSHRTRKTTKSRKREEYAFSSTSSIAMARPKLVALRMAWRGVVIVFSASVHSHTTNRRLWQSAAEQTWLHPGRRQARQNIHNDFPESAELAAMRRW